MKKIRPNCAVLAVLIASQLAVMGSAAAAGATLNVGKADANASPILPVNVADKLGLFKKHRLEVKIANFTGGSKLSQAMLAGSIDIGVGAGTEMAFVAKGAPIIAVCDDAPSIPFIGIAVPWDSPIHTIGQLKSKKIGISSAGSLTDWLARELAHHEGWGPEGVKPVAIGNGATAVLAAFRTQAIDADIAVTSNIFNWEEKKQARLLNSSVAIRREYRRGNDLRDPASDRNQSQRAAWLLGRLAGDHRLYEQAQSRDRQDRERSYRLSRERDGEGIRQHERYVQQGLQIRCRLNR